MEASESEQEYSDSDSDFENDILAQVFLEPVPAFKSEDGWLYCVKSRRGICFIEALEVESSDNNQAKSVFEFHSDHCLGFSVSGNQFFVMDSHCNVLILEKDSLSNKLVQVNSKII